MERLWACAALLAAGACNQVFGLEPPAGDDGTLDGAPGGGDATSTRWGTVMKVGVASDASAFEEDPALSPDGLELYFSYQPTLSIQKDLYRATRSSPMVDFVGAAPELALNSTENDLAPRLSADGLHLYFASDRPNGPGALDVVRADRGSPTSPWTVAGFEFVLSSAANDRHTAPCLGRDRFVVSSQRAGTLTSDLYELSGNGEGLDTLGLVNTGFDELGAFVTEDCLTLYFSSNRDGDFDLYVATRDQAHEPWGAAAQIEELATAAAETDPWVSADQRHILFSTTFNGGLDVVEAFR